MRAALTSFGFLLLPVLIGLVSLCGCDKTPPPITKRTYTIPAVIVKQQAEQAQIQKNIEQHNKQIKDRKPVVPDRMLAAIVPQPDTDFFWTFKSQGKPEDLEAVKPQLIKILSSLQWKTKKPELPEWQLPEGWQVKTQAEDSFGRRAFIFYREEERVRYFITVGRLTNNDDWNQAVISNLNRWRGQLELDPIAEADLDKAVEKIPFTGGDALLLDITNVPPLKPEATPAETKTAPQPESTPEKDKEKGPVSVQTEGGLLTYEVPATWKSKPPSTFRFASFDVTEDGRKAEVSLSVFSTNRPEMGKLLPNVNRWRGELSLPPATETELPEQTTELQIPAGPATIFTATGTRQGAPASTLAAMLVRGDWVWFVKIQGDATLVSKQRPVFEEFLKSLKFKEEK